MRALILAPAIVVAALGCGSGETPTTTTTSTSTTSSAGGSGAGGSSPFDHPWLTDARVLVSGEASNTTECRAEICRHNENTDLVTWKGAIWLVHRTAMSQVLGPNSSLRVSRSTDGGATFETTAILPAPLDRDLRDPHFYVVGEKLHIKALTRLPVISTRDSDVDTVAVGAASSDGVAWSSFAPIGPSTWSFWRIRQHAGTYYTAAYEDGDKSVSLFTSTDGVAWTKGPSVYAQAEDTPLETELVFMPSGKLLALVRMDGTDDELLAGMGRLRTKVCWSDPPYDKDFDCPDTLDGQRLDGPVAFFHDERLFVVARKHLGADGRKRTSLFEIAGDLDGGKLSIDELGELPSGGDTAYAGAADIDDQRVLVTWYSGNVEKDAAWIFGMLDITDVWRATIDFSKLGKPK